jgi:hypothetical protein
VTALADLEARVEALADHAGAPESAQALLDAAEEILEHWVRAHGEEPTTAEREGFRLLALHRQGTRGQPSFNACRETCREIAYHYNLLRGEPDAARQSQRQRMMALLVKHLFYFVSGKLQEARLGELCCSARPLRLESA